MCEEFGHFQMVGVETTVKILSGVNGRVLSARLRPLSHPMQ
jgi:hypothetical protein